MDSEQVFITTADGNHIAARLFPAAQARAMVLLHPATAVTQGSRVTSRAGWRASACTC
jgi:hypothetical protein